MDKSKIKEVMEELSRGSKNRPASARLKDIFEDIEIALLAGYLRGKRDVFP